MWIVDSSVWIDYFNGTASPQVALLDHALGNRSLALGDIILCEVLQGFRDDGDFSMAQSALLTFPIFALGGQDVALQAAANYRTLRTRGITVRKTIDCLIATFCIERGFALLHSDRDFAPFEEHLDLVSVIAS